MNLFKTKLPPMPDIRPIETKLAEPKLPPGQGYCCVCAKPTSWIKHGVFLCLECRLPAIHNPKPEPEQRYVVVPAKREDMVFVMELPWRIVCACPTQAVAQRIADLLGKDDQAIPF